jgi:starch-binding outer membrane protein, SusD/RagB family
MKKHKFPKGLLIIFSTLSILIIAACKKQDNWLDIKNEKSSVTPKTLKDLQAVLDNAQVMNFNCPVIGELGSDNIYFTDANISSLTAPNRNAYLWQKDIFQGAVSTDWNNPFQMIGYANIVLNGLSGLDNKASNASFNNIKGSALFYRAFAYYNLAQLFCKPYTQQTAATDLGLPIRLNADVNEKSMRSTIQETYNQIIQDLTQAQALLPATPLYRTRPSSIAAIFLLAKVYLIMQNYPLALQYSDQVMNSNFTLLDFKSLPVTASQPFPSFAKGNSEIVFYAYTLGNSAVWPLSSTGRVDPTLYNTYNSNDLRKTAFYSLDTKSGLYRFKGSYDGLNYYNFSGFAINEALLIRAESKLRTGNDVGSLADLNLLLKSRSDNAFTGLNLTDGQQILSRILLERRKELPFTGNIRWEDLRRINLSSPTAVTLTRLYNGTTYTLPPNSSLYTLPIPQNEIDANGIEQNQR